LLREKDIMQPTEASTPVRRIYFPIMMMYLGTEDNEKYYNDFALRMTEFMGAVRNRAVLTSCVEISRDVMSGAYYKALMLCKKLYEFEGERLRYEPQSYQNTQTTTEDPRATESGCSAGQTGYLASPINRYSVARGSFSSCLRVLIRLVAHSAGPFSFEFISFLQSITPVNRRPP